VEQATFSIVQEALGNTRKHARATEVQVQMQETGEAWIIQVSDNGRGFDVNGVLRTYENRGSLGLLNMRERAAAIDGQLTLQSAPGQGTTVTLRIPSTLTTMAEATEGRPDGAATTEHTGAGPPPLST
jgi:signal transduction histidine kinase